MEQLEGIEPEMKKAEQEVAAKENSYKELSTKCDKRLEEIEKEFEEIAIDKPALVEQIEKTLYRRYEFIRQRYPNTLVTVENGTCGGCHTRIPPQMFNEMLTMTELKDCPSCRRIIFIEEKEEEETNSV